MFATHFHEISELEKLHPGKVKNNRMDTFVEEGNLVILFQVVPGVAQKSFGLEIAQLVGFSKEILDVRDFEHFIFFLNLRMQKRFYMNWKGKA